jgi:hypothetical protein
MHTAGRVLQVVLCLLAGAGIVWSCANTPQGVKAAQAEADICRARAEYKQVAALARGRLDPAPGSQRARLEAAEDAFCALGGGDGGP